MTSPRLIDRSKCPARRHGRYWTRDKHGCCCPDAIYENTVRKSLYRRGLLPPGYLDATGTRRRLQALAVEGWTIARLVDLTGLSERSLRYALNARTRVQATTARAVSKVYDRIAGLPGGAKAVTTRAVRRGWLDSYHWPDHLIDDPDGKPWFGDDAADIDRAERLAEISRLVRAGQTVDQIAAVVRLNPRTVQRHLQAIRAAANTQQKTAA